MPDFPLTATISGSHHRALDQIQAALNTLQDLGIKILSPVELHPETANPESPPGGEDNRRVLRLLQQHHLDCIQASDFLWLVAPLGYVGDSAALEIGFALASQIPVYSLDVPEDIILREFVTTLSDPQELYAQLHLVTETSPAPTPA